MPFDALFQRILRKLSGEDVEPVVRSDGLRPGRAVLRGTIRAAEPVTSPLNARVCAGFYYRASYRYNSRMRGFIQQKLRDALCYGGGLTLSLLEDGRQVDLVPQETQPFAADEHAALKAQRIDGFKAKERVIKDGATVVVRGRLRRTRGTAGPPSDVAWTLRFQQLEVEETEEKKAKREKKAKKGTAGRKRGRQRRGRG